MSTTSFGGRIRSQTGFAAYSDTATDNVSMPLATQGTGVVLATTSNIFPLATVTSIATASAVAYTAAQFKGGLILRNPSGLGRADTVPTAALLVAAIPSAVVGTSFDIIIRNDAGAAETITVTTAAGATLSGTMTIAQNNMRGFLAVLTNVTAGAEAYTLYSLGTVVF